MEELHFDCLKCTAGRQVAILSNAHNALVHFEASHGQEGSVCTSCWAVMAEEDFDGHFRSDRHRRGKKRAAFLQHEDNFFEEPAVYEALVLPVPEVVEGEPHVEAQPAIEKAPSLIFGLDIIVAEDTYKVSSFSEVEKWVTENGGRTARDRVAATPFLKTMTEFGLTDLQIERMEKYLEANVCPPCDQKFVSNAADVAANSFLKMPLLYGPSADGPPAVIRNFYFVPMVQFLHDLLTMKEVVESLVFSPDVGGSCSFAKGEIFHRICLDAFQNFSLPPVCVALYSDSTQIVRVGQRSLWPIYGRILNTTLKAKCVTRVVGFIPQLNLQELEVSEEKLRKLRLGCFQAAFHAVCFSGFFHRRDRQIVVNGKCFIPYVGLVQCDSKDLTRMAGARGGHRASWTCLHCDNRKDASKSLVSFLPRFIEAQNAYVLKVKNGNRFPAGTEERLKNVSMHVVDNFTVNLRAFDLSFNSGPCTLHLFDCNFSKKMIKWIGVVLGKLKDGLLEDFNERLFIVGGSLAKTFETSGKIRGKCLLPRKTGKDIRELMDLVPFALVGVVGEESHGWLLNLTIWWTRLRELVNGAEAKDVLSLEEIDRRVKDCMPLIEKLHSLGKTKDNGIEDQPTFHQFLHLSLCVRRAGSLRELATDGFEKFHEVVKHAFMKNTNRCVAEETVVPQVMRSLAKREFGRGPIREKVVKEQKLGIVNPQKVKLGKALSCVNLAVSLHVHVNSSLFLDLVISKFAGSVGWRHSELTAWFGGNVDSASPAMLKDVVVFVGTGLRLPFGRVYDYRGSKNTLIQLVSGRFAVVVLVARFPFHNSSSMGLDEAIFCKYVESFIRGQIVDERFGLPCLFDALPFDNLSSYGLVRASEIQSIWSLMPVFSPDKDMKSFYARKTLE